MKKRYSGPDLVRCLALCCVIVTHAIAYTGVMDHITSPLYPIWLILRFGAMSGVPLFLLLSGYFCCEKEGGKRYYAGILPILLSYAVVSLAVIVIGNLTGLTQFTPFGALRGLLNFTAHGYAWYVEMYIGLFLLIPFLNVLWRGLGSQRSRGILILTLIALTILPPTLQSFRIFGETLDIVPDFWTALYPLTYYYIGAYLRSYPPTLSRARRIGLAAAATALPCALCYLFTMLDGSYAWYMMNGYASVTVLLTGVSYFLLLYDLEITARIPLAVVTQVSLCSFEMYLCSYLTDQGIFYLLNRLGVETAGLRFLCLVCGSLLLSFPIAFALHFLSRAATRRFGKESKPS